jgi:hypothetical protein
MCHFAPLPRQALPIPHLGDEAALSSLTRALPSGLGACRSAWMRRSRILTWFQLAKFRLTTFIPNSRSRSRLGWVKS